MGHKVKQLHEKVTNESNTIIDIDKLKKEISSLSVDEQNVILQQILLESNKVNAEHLKAIKDYQDLLKSRKVNNNKRRVVKKEKVKPKQKEYINDEISKHQEEIKKVISLDIETFSEYYETLKPGELNFLILGLFRELKEYQNMATHAYKENDTSELMEIKAMALELEEKITLLKELREEQEFEKEICKDDTKKCKIIFFETPTNKPYFIEDIEGHEESFNSFKRLFRSIQMGNPKNIKRFDGHLTGLSEARDMRRQTRIFFDKISDDTYIIINAIIKKSDNSKGYREQLIERYRNYQARKEAIIESINDLQFLKRQADYVEQAEELFEKARENKRG